MTEDGENRPIEIRRATSSDAAAIATLSEQLGYPATAGQIENRLGAILDDPDQILLVAESRGQVIGWIQGAAMQPVESDRSVEIMGLVVEQARRSGGVGRSLLGRVEAWAREKGAVCVTLRSNIIRTRAHAFYLNLGYEITKTQHAFCKTLE